MNELKVFENEQFGEIKELERNNKNKHTGFFYILQWDNLIKIGSTKNPYQRIMALKRIAEKYGKSRIGKVAFSMPHTNYFENEQLLHNMFSVYRKESSELFELNFEIAISNIPCNIKYLDESEMINEKSETFLDEMKTFVLGGDKAMGVFKTIIADEVVSTSSEANDGSSIDEFFINMYFDELDNGSKEELRKNLATLR